jgi:ATP-dependent DNA ligase
MGTVDPRSILVETIFTRRGTSVSTSAFIKAMHPKSEIRGDREAIARILSAGWIGQMKIHGHRAQIHISSDPDQEIIAYTRQGKCHTMAIPPLMQKELRRLFTPEKGWNVIDAEWLKPKKKLFVFDFLKQEGKTLRNLTYPQRWELLPRHFISPHISVLPLLRDVSACIKVMETTSPHVEGLVFKSGTSTGFSDTSIVRCRIKK